MISRPEDVEQARRILHKAYQSTVARLVSFTIENEEPLDSASTQDYDSTGVTERLARFQQEVFVLCYLLGALPASPQPAPNPKPPVEKGSP